jgi:trehalose 6-phosphate phosphatase
MKHLLSVDGKKALRALLSERPLLAFDFDGTLSPTVMMAREARMPQGLARTLQEICDTLPCAVISGRGIDDMRKRLPIQPKYVIGNHGAEGIAWPENHLLGLKKICESWMTQVEDQLAWADMGPGLVIEPKAYSICLHFRLALQRAQTVNALQASFAQLKPAPHLIWGDSSVDLLPENGPTKRIALEHLLKLEDRQRALYIGDDVADEHVFLAAPPEWMTVRIGRDKHSNARYFLYHQTEMMDCLQFIARVARLTPHHHTH